MASYSVKQVAQMAKISVRTLHLYDQIGLLKPSKRSHAGYRLYTEAELLRLQQVLLYREMEMPLQVIAAVLDDPNFNLPEALVKHKAALKAKRTRLLTILKTIEKTITNIKNDTMENYQELYDGFLAEEAAAMRNEAMAKWPEKTSYAEAVLLKAGKTNFKALQAEQQDITDALIKLMNEQPESAAVQFEIARHYQNIRSFWGTQQSKDKQPKQYAGLADLYVADPRYTRINGEPSQQFGLFMSKAMKYFAAKL